MPAAVDEEKEYLVGAGAAGGNLDAGGDPDGCSNGEGGGNLEGLREVRTWPAGRGDSVERSLGTLRLKSQQSNPTSVLLRPQS